MTKYILHGGVLKRDSESNAKFFQEVAKDLPVAASVLYVPFARDKSLWKDFFAKTKAKFTSAVPEKKIDLILADENIDTFTKQIIYSDAVLMIGGDTHILLNFLKQIPNIEKLWQNKTVAGSSAGAQVLCRYFCRMDFDGVFEGLGILNKKVFVHWSKERLYKLKPLEDIGEKLEVLKIPEEEFIVLNK